MGIKFDVSDTNQGISFFQDIKEEGYQKLIEFSGNHNTLVRFTGIPIFLCEFLLDLAIAVCMVVEPIIKGVANICGCPFFEKCKLSKGIKQIFLELPLNLLFIAVLLPLLTVGELILIPIGMVIFPDWLLNSRINGEGPILTCSFTVQSS